MGNKGPDELELIDWIGQQDQRLPDSIVRALGDDCAVFDSTIHPRLAVTTDMLVEEIHFKRAWISPDFLGRKSLLVNLSDLAAAGSHPYACLLSLGLPGELTGQYFNSFMTGFLQESSTWKAPLIGGDLSDSPNLVISVTAWGFLRSAPSGWRTNARNGDLLVVVGELGFSRLGLALLEAQEGTPLADIRDEDSLKKWAGDDFRFHCLRAHLLPRPLVEVGEWLSEEALPNALMDVSDGLAIDLLRICRASGVAAEIESGRLPTPPVGIGAITPLEAALDGGEDYALLFTLPPERLEDLSTKYPSQFPPFRVVGHIFEGEPAVYLSSGGTRQRYQPGGYLHHRPGGEREPEGGATIQP